MPNYLKPVVKYTPEQMKSVLARIIARRGTPKLAPTEGGMNPAAARGMLDMPMAKENTYGQLMDRMDPQNPVTKTMPINEAMLTYMTDPERYSRLPVGPPAKHVFPGPPNPAGDASSLGGSIASERMKFQDPLPPMIGRNQGVIKKTIMPQVGKMEPKPKLAPSSVGDVLNLATRYEDLWKVVGMVNNRNSAVANLWKMYLQGSNQKGNVKNAKDYFIASAVRNHNNPQMMAKQFPREKRLLDKMKEVYKEKVGVDLDTGVPVKPSEVVGE